MEASDTIDNDKAKIQDKEVCSRCGSHAVFMFNFGTPYCKACSDFYNGIPTSSDDKDQKSSSIRKSIEKHKLKVKVEVTVKLKVGTNSSKVSSFK